MKTDLIFSDYHGASYFLEAHSDKDLMVFVIDDNKLYLNLLRNMLKSKKINVHTFETGEESLKALDLKPDIVIIDYHLDGVDPNAKKGDLIAEMIHEKLPNSEIILISSDQKFKLLMDLKMSMAKNFMYKDMKTPSLITQRVVDLKEEKMKGLTYKRSLWILFIIILPAIIILWLIWKFIFH